MTTTDVTFVLRSYRDQDNQVCFVCPKYERLRRVDPLMNGFTGSFIYPSFNRIIEREDCTFQLQNGIFTELSHHSGAKPLVIVLPPLPSSKIPHHQLQNSKDVWEALACDRIVKDDKGRRVASLGHHVYFTESFNTLPIRNLHKWSVA